MLGAGIVITDPSNKKRHCVHRCNIAMYRLWNIKKKHKSELTGISVFVTRIHFQRIIKTDTVCSDRTQVLLVNYCHQLLCTTSRQNIDKFLIFCIYGHSEGNVNGTW